MTLNFTSQTHTIPTNKLPLYGATQQPSPASSSATASANVSPTSPRLSNYIAHQFPSHYRQLRPPKTPLYVPAVLRPTEFPNKHSPPASPPQKEDSLEGASDKGFGAFIHHESIEAENQSPLNLALQREILAGGELGDVTGPPKRDHWRPDNASPTCDSPQCRSSFGLFVRKHHCRHCGHIFCSVHSPHTIPLDQNAQFHPDGERSRACEHCYKVYQRWEVAHKLRQSAKHRRGESGAEELGLGTKSAPVTPMLGTSGQDSRVALSNTLDSGQEEVASSTPRDWQWSTF